MATWYPKEFGNLTGVSVRTLHHYDEIDLLKPSLRLPNGYRVYSEDDLVKLEQIVALKFFGLSLKEIKELLQKDVGVHEHLVAQHKMLQSNIAHLQQVSRMLDKVLAQDAQKQQVDWQILTKLIKEYTMIKKLRETWAAEIYTDEQLKQFVELGQKYSQKEIEAWQEKWPPLIKEVEASLDQDPKGEVGKRLASAWYTLLNQMYGDYPELNATRRKAYKEGRIPNPPFSKHVFEWIDTAIEHWIR